MQALKAVIRSLGLLFLLGVLFGIIFITDTLLLTSKQNQLNYIPAEAELVVRIHSRAIIEQTLQSVLIDSEDTKLVNTLYRKLKQQTKKGKRITNDGIDYLSDIVLFQLPFKTSYVLGILVKLNDEDAFEETIGSTVSAQRVAVTHNEVGLILTYKGKENDHASSIDLEQLADNILSNSTQKQKAPQSNKSLVSVGGKLGRFELHLAKNTLEFSGTFSPNTSINRPAGNRLQAKGFHLSASHLSDLPFAMDDVPLENISFNFLGIGAPNDYGIPKINFELLVGFHQKIDVATLLKDKIGDALVFSDDKQEISVMNHSYYFKKLNDSSFYMGSTKAPVLERTNSSNLFQVSGNPSSFFAYKSNSIALTVIEMNPLFHATKQLAQATQSMNIQLVKKDEKRLDFTGQICFKKGKSPINEMIRFLMSANFLP